jgi:glutathione synthase/RimK-type ligase-like ATP-grasp enzyme
MFASRILDVEAAFPKVVILTRTSDAGADAVGLRLLASGIPYVRIDADSLPEAATLTIASMEGTDETFEAAVRSRGWGAENPRVVWFRHFDTHAIGSSLEDPLARSFVQAEWELAVRALLTTRAVRWVNRPSEVYGLDRVRQLRLARHAGLVIPKTLVSNDPRRIRRFVASSGKAVVKVLGEHFLEPTPSIQYGVFPRLVSESDLEGAEPLALSPAIYQEYVPHVAEIRATAIGRDLTAAAVTETGFADVWECPENVSVQEHRLPDDVRCKLAAYMRHARLQYGAFDLLLTPDGRYVFLEVNPVGDWTWLEWRNEAIDITGKVASYIVDLSEAAAS